MKTLRTLFRSAVPAACAAGLLVSQAAAVPVAVPKQSSSFVAVASDCYAVGQQVAAQNGGTLAKASQATRGGRPVCVIVVLVPGKNGQRPRRAEIVVPQN
jgi:hypothetical protein